MADTIIIKSLKTQFVRHIAGNSTTERTIDTAAFLNDIQAADLILPDNTKYFNKLCHGHYVMVIQHPPDYRTITMQMDMTYRWRQFKSWATDNNVEEAIDYIKDKFKKSTFGYELHRFRILHPYMIYVIRINHRRNGCAFRIHVSKKPIKALTNMMYSAPFFNISYRNRVCMDNRGISFLATSGPLAKQVDAVITNFWMSHFNSDYDSNMRLYRNRIEYANLFVWDFLSNNYPDKMFEVRLSRYKSLKLVLERVRREGIYDINPVRRFQTLTAPEVTVAKEKTAKKKLP